MAGRPEKYTISYFPHYTKDSKSIFIIENKYGIEGYYFWFKLLELLCTTKGLYYDCNIDGSMDYLAAKTRTSNDKASDILETLANIECIDKELWRGKIIWCQNLVDNVSDVFKRRKNDIPQKPESRIIVDNNSINVDNNSVKEYYCKQDVNNNSIIAPQIKLNKIKENIINNINNNSPIDVLPIEQKSKAKPKINFNFETNKWENISSEDLEIFAKAYPACELKVEFAQMKAWILAAGAKGRKQNWRAFINRWLAKAQDKGGTRGISR